MGADRIRVYPVDPCKSVCHFFSCLFLVGRPCLDSLWALVSGAPFCRVTFAATREESRFWRHDS
jgi:hypothetical protein